MSLNTVLSNVRSQSGINQIRGVTPAGAVGSGIPKHVSTVTALMSNASAGSTSKVTVSFQRDPTDRAFAGVTVYVKGYQGNQTATQVGYSADSPVNVLLNNTGESVSLIVQATGNGGNAPLPTAPSCGIRLPKNVTGGFGTQTTTNLTSTQVQQIVTSNPNLLTVKKTLSSADILAGTAYTLVAAPGAGKIALPFSLVFKYTYNSIVYANQGAAAIYNGLTGFASGVTFISLNNFGLWNSSHNNLTFVPLNNLGWNTGVLDDSGTSPSNTYENRPIRISTFNMANGNGTFTVWLTYVIADVA